MNGFANILVSSPTLQFNNYHLQNHASQEGCSQMHNKSFSKDCFINKTDLMHSIALTYIYRTQHRRTAWLHDGVGTQGCYH